MMQTYELMTLRVQTMLQFAEPTRDAGNNWTIRFRYDFRGKSNVLKNAIVRSVDLYEETALTYQLKAQLLGVDGQKDVSEVSVDLSKTLLYLDFQDVFNGRSGDRTGGKTPKKEALGKLSTDEKLRILFRDGLTLIFDDGFERNYVPFDKSASMARSSAMTFVDRTVKGEMDSRLMLDIPHSSIKTNLSKLYAYRGLYLTAARRLTLGGDFVMNAETVIVIRDKFTLVKDQLLQTAVESADVPDRWLLSQPKKGDVRINVFDGEGLISPEYAGRINEQLASVYGFTRTASSFQIRMPFAKGVLHEVDFHSFAREVTGCEDVMVTDIFGIKRSLRKAKLILTAGMFKCNKWLASYVGEQDPMVYYFDKFRHYGHSLYVGNTDANLSFTGRVKLSYQFLNTLALTGEAFETLIAQQKRAISLAKNNCMKLHELITPQADERGDDHVAPKEPAWALALAKNSAFLHDPKITGMLNGIENGMLRDCGLGRMDVAGECRFISRDLLSLLVHLLECSEEKWELLDYVKGICMRRDRFYLPAPSIPLDPMRNYGMLRNPHLSRNEQAVLKPYVAKKEDTNFYTKYFSHLRGVVMVPYRSMVPMTLSGCDFDGDLVKIIAEPVIVKAILEGVYSSTGEERRLPTIEIPSIGSRDAVVPDAVDYETVKNTFSSRVGYISNLAIKFGKKEYSNDPDGQRFAGKCAECTIVTGLEIDAAKTGRHPDLSPMEALDSREKDYFLQIKEQIEGLSLKQGLVFTEVNKPDGSEILVSYKKANQPYLRVRVLPADEEAANIDRLPYQFVRLLREKRESKTEKKASAKAAPVYFRFQLEEDWRKGLDGEKLAALRGIIGSYRRIHRLAARVQHVREKYRNTKYAACVYHLLTVKYDAMEAQLLPGITVQDALYDAYALLDSVIETYDGAKALLTRIVEENWQFTEQSARKAVLARLLDIGEAEISPEIEALLCDFRCSGYKLLYYIAKDVWCQSAEAFAQNLVDEAECDADLSLYTEMRLCYRDAMQKKASQKIWERDLLVLCRQELSKLFDDDFDSALRYAFSLRSTADQSGTFFWSVFRADEILRNVNSGGGNDAQ